MLRAVALAVAEKGYGETVVTDVIERAHVSRKTFYEHFADLQDCFRQAHATACDTLLGEIVEASTRPGGLRDDSQRYWRLLRPDRRRAGD
jgi:AcrR family transcriptional regulator